VSGGPEHKTLSVLPLDPGSSGLLKGLAEFMGACAAVCLEERRHRSGVRALVEGDHEGMFVLSWAPLTSQHRLSCADLQEATEFGAYGVAILVVREVTGKTVLERSAKGTGFDYWVGDEENAALPFQNLTRLEVSGILNGSPADIQSRVKVKKKQVTPSDTRGLAFIAVVEFGRPVIRLETK
jgi:hypothetical protein